MGGGGGGGGTEIKLTTNYLILHTSTTLSTARVGMDYLRVYMHMLVRYFRSVSLILETLPVPGTVQGKPRVEIVRSIVPYYT